MNQINQEIIMFENKTGALFANNSVEVLILILKLNITIQIG
jgi:hypothetical protein